jgi:RNA polymerase sigma-70 factor (ECF subfamily)
MSSPLSGLFRAHCSTGEVPDESQIDALWRLGRSAWPGIEVSVEAFALHLAAGRTDEPLADWLNHVHATDLYLACACAARVERALAMFDEHYLSRVGVFLSRLRPEPVWVEEICQVLREKLFVGESPKILDYSGRGTLGNWLRVVTVRTALNLASKRTELLEDRDGQFRTREEPTGADPELEYIKEHYRSAFELALAASLAALTGEQRNLLRLHFIDRVSLDGLARLFHVHRATIARRISRARDAIVEHAREDLRRRLAIAPAEFESLMGLLASRLELSVTRLLEASSSDAPGLTGTG